MVYLPSALKLVSITDEAYIGFGAFSNLDIERINLSNDTVLTIGDYAFYNSGIRFMNDSQVYSLEQDHYRINLPESLTLLKSHAFDGAYNMESLRIMQALSYDSTDSNAIVPIETHAFANELNLSDVKFENNFIGEYMFANDTGLEELVVDACVEYISNSFLFEVAHLKKLTVPFIGRTMKAYMGEDGTIDYSFRDKDAVLAWFFGEEEEIREDYKEYMSKIVQEYNEDLTTWAYMPTSLTDLTITTADYVSYGALDQVRTLTNVTLETDALRLIDNYSFRNTGIRNIRIPSSVLALNKGAFKEDYRLRSVRLDRKSVV